MILPCGKEECPQHGDLCAFHGDEQGLCPWCHSSWDRIISTNWHTCEKKNNWPARVRKTRVVLAKARRHAHQRPEIRDRGTFCAHVGNSPTND